MVSIGFSYTRVKPILVYGYQIERTVIMYCVMEKKIKKSFSLFPKKERFVSQGMYLYGSLPFNFGTRDCHSPTLPISDKYKVDDRRPIGWRIPQ